MCVRSAYKLKSVEKFLPTFVRVVLVVKDQHFGCTTRLSSQETGVNRLKHPKTADIWIQYLYFSAVYEIYMLFVYNFNHYWQGRGALWGVGLEGRHTKVMWKQQKINRFRMKVAEYNSKIQLDSLKVPEVIVTLLGYLDYFRLPEDPWIFFNSLREPDVFFTLFGYWEYFWLS